MMNSELSNIILWVFIFTLIGSLLYFGYKLACRPFLKTLYPFERNSMPNEIYMILIINFVAMLVTPTLESIGINLFLIISIGRVIAVILGAYIALWVVKRLSIDKSSYMSVAIFTMIFVFTNGIDNSYYFSKFTSALSLNGTFFNNDTVMMFIQFVVIFVSSLVFAGMILTTSLARFKGHRKVELLIEGDDIRGLLLGYNDECFKIFDTKTKSTTEYNWELSKNLTVSKERDVVDNYIS